MKIKSATCATLCFISGILAELGIEDQCLSGVVIKWLQAR